MKYQGIVRDRMRYLPPEKTCWYDTYAEAHAAAERLCNVTYSGDRGEVDVITKTP